MGRLGPTLTAALKKFRQYFNPQVRIFTFGMDDTLEIIMQAWKVYEDNFNQWN